MNINDKSSQGCLAKMVMNGKSAIKKWHGTGSRATPK
jgi:hypothetical protein